MINNKKLSGRIKPNYTIAEDVRTNQQIVTKLFQSYKCGPMAELVIMEAIRHYTSVVGNQPEQEDEPNSLISRKEWRRVCIILNSELNEMYVMNDDPEVRRAYQKAQEENK